MKYLVLLSIFASPNLLASTKVFECSGPIYDSKADLMRQAKFAFAVGPKRAGSQEKVYVEFSKEHSEGSLHFGIGDCVSKGKEDLSCKVKSTHTEKDLPQEITVLRKNGELTLEKSSGFKGKLSCKALHTDYSVLNFSWVKIPKKAGDVTAFTVEVRQDTEAEIGNCWAQIYGILHGKRLMGVSIDDCTVVPGEKSTKLVHFKGIAPKEFNPKAQHHINFFSLQNKNSAHGSAFSGHGLQGF